MEDIHAACADGHAQSDFAGPLRHRHIHDVHNPNTAHDQRDTRYDKEQIIQASGLFVGQSLLSVNKVQAYERIAAAFPYIESMEITNRTVRSFLYYVPYVTLALMVFPAIVEATQVPLSGFLALLVGILLAWRGTSMFVISALCCLTVFASEAVLL